MHVSDVDPNVLRAAGAALGVVLGIAASRSADALPRRYGIARVPDPEGRARRTRVLIVLTAACALAIGHVLTRAPELDVGHATLLLAVNCTLVAVALASAAIDLEHMILPDELTFGGAAIALLSSPLRSVGPVGSLAGAIVGVLATSLPSLLHRRLRGTRGVGLGDAKMAAMAGAWHGVEGALLVVLGGAVQLALAALLLRLRGIEPPLPASVADELAELRQRADAGDREAEAQLADDPMAAPARSGWLGMRLALGPFLALACVEVLFLRRWLVEHLFAALGR